MARTDKVRSAVDRAFDLFDKGFEAAQDSFQAAAEEVNGLPAEPLEPGYHQIRFAAKNWRERGRLFRRFTRLACAALFTGKAEFRFVNKKQKQ